MRVMKLTKINGQWMAAGNDPFHPEPDRARTDPTPHDRRFSPNPKVTRISQGLFYVSDLVAQASVAHRSHTFSAECEYCHQSVKVHLFAPENTPKYWRCASVISPRNIAATVKAINPIVAMVLKR